MSSSCFTTPTATQFETVTSTGVSITTSDSLSRVAPTTTTILSTFCAATSQISSTEVCVSTGTQTVTSVISGTGVVTVQVPITVPFTVITTTPTATAYSTSCVAIQNNPNQNNPPKQDTTTTTSSSLSSSSTSRALITTTPAPITTTIKSSSTLVNGQVTVMSFTSTMTPAPIIVASAAPTVTSNHKTPVAAIAGGIAGGAVVLGLVSYILWKKIWAKPSIDKVLAEKAAKHSKHHRNNDDNDSQKSDDENQSQNGDNNSIHRHKLPRLTKRRSSEENKLQAPNYEYGVVGSGASSSVIPGPVAAMAQVHSRPTHGRNHSSQSPLIFNADHLRPPLTHAQSSTVSAAGHAPLQVAHMSGRDSFATDLESQRMSLVSTGSTGGIAVVGPATPSLGMVGPSAANVMAAGPVHQRMYGQQPPVGQGASAGGMAAGPTSIAMLHASTPSPPPQPGTPYMQSQSPSGPVFVHQDGGRVDPNYYPQV